MTRYVALIKVLRMLHETHFESGGTKKREEVRSGSSRYGCAPVAAGTCVPRVFVEEMTGDPAMLPSGCVEDIDVMPAIMLEELTGVVPAGIPDPEPILTWSFTMG